MAYIKQSTVFFVIFLATSVLFCQVETFGDCLSDSSSSFLQYCCEKKIGFADNVCRSNCIGLFCSENSDCAPNECCGSDNKCQEGSCSLAGWIVAVIVISVIVVIAIPTGIIVFCCCCAAAASRRPARGGVVVAQPATTGATVVLTHAPTTATTTISYTTRTTNASIISKPTDAILSSWRQPVSTSG